MRSFFSRKLVVLAAALAVLGGAAGALAATQGSAGAGRQAYLGDVAKRLGVSSGALSAAIKAADVDRIEAAVAAGRMSPSRAGALKQRIQQGTGAPLFAFGAGAGRAGGHAAAAAQYLGISVQTLRSDRRAGRSLAEIASTTPGKSVQGLKAAIIAAAQARLAGAVSSGEITAQQARERADTLSGRVEALVQRTALRPHHRGSGRGSHRSP